MLELIKTFWREGLLVVLALSMWMMSSHYNSVISDRDATISKDAETLLKHIKDEAVCKNTLYSQTLQITANQVDLDKKTKELNEWKSKPEKVRYETIPSIISEVKSNDCNDTKKSIDLIRTIDFNSL